MISGQIMAKKSYAKEQFMLGQEKKVRQMINVLGLNHLFRVD